ncbi:hypothetical protein V5T82_07095 [Magnetovibrio sp. PR-2]|uniref:hypothetical protein n=1 Tax=Magnetovibrio sp. PR-2 TaxID=3120356 RepID=UPI002FCDF613
MMNKIKKKYAIGHVCALLVVVVMSGCLMGADREVYSGPHQVQHEETVPEHKISQTISLKSAHQIIINLELLTRNVTRIGTTQYLEYTHYKGIARIYGFRNFIWPFKCDHCELPQFSRHCDDCEKYANTYISYEKPYLENKVTVKTSPWLKSKAPDFDISYNKSLISIRETIIEDGVVQLEIVAKPGAYLSPPDNGHVKETRTDIMIKHHSASLTSAIAVWIAN